MRNFVVGITSILIVVFTSSCTGSNPVNPTASTNRAATNVNTGFDQGVLGSWTNHTYQGSNNGYPTWSRYRWVVEKSNVTWYSYNYTNTPNTFMSLQNTSTFKFISNLVDGRTLIEATNVSNANYYSLVPGSDTNYFVVKFALSNGGIFSSLTAFNGDAQAALTNYATVFNTFYRD